VTLAGDLSGLPDIGKRAVTDAVLAGYERTDVGEGADVRQ
jgi:hypothetical protein